MKINFEKLALELSSAGMHKVRVKEAVKQLKQDMVDWPEVYADKVKYTWALERGFLPGRVCLYGEGFNENTYKDYYADFDYFMAHPLNNHFAIWINDKITLKYMLNNGALGKYIPEYYLYIENDGHYTYLMDSPENVKKDKNYLYNLLLEKKHLAMKPNHGAGGAGFVGMKYEDGRILRNGTEITREEFEKLIATLDGYVVTEFIEQSDAMNQVFGEADCALRIILYKKPRTEKAVAAEFDCLMSYARFGVKKSEGASNLSRGGLAVRINWETGTYEGNYRGRVQFWGNDCLAGFREHPDSGVVLDGKQVPNWELIKTGLLEICNYMSSLDFFGMDVIVTEAGFKLCEINSAPSVGLGQFSYGKCCLNNNDKHLFAQNKRRPFSKSFLDCVLAAVEEE